jgi:hypothetical protein
VLERGNAALDEGGRDAWGDRVHDRGRDENAARFRQAFEAGGDDQGFATGQVVLEQNFAEVHADA